MTVRDLAEIGHVGAGEFCNTFRHSAAVLLHKVECVHGLDNSNVLSIRQ